MSIVNSQQKYRVSINRVFSANNVLIIQNIDDTKITVY
mgnify:FL=1